MDILESLRRNAKRKSDLDADKDTMNRAANEIERLRGEVDRALRNLEGQCKCKASSGCHAAMLRSRFRDALAANT